MIKIKYLFFLFTCCCVNVFAQHHLVLADGSIHQSGGEIVLHNTSFANHSGTTALHSEVEGKVRITGYSLEQFSEIGGTYPTTFNTLIIDKEYNNSALKQDVSIKEALILLAGNLDLQENNLTLQYGSTIINASKNAYIKTSGEGMLRIAHLGEEVYMPIGNSTFNPLTISALDFGLANIETYESRVMDIDGSGIGEMSNNEVIGLLPRIWYLKSSSNSEELLDVAVQWNKSEEATYFEESGISMNYLSTENQWKFLDAPTNNVRQAPYTLSGRIDENSEMITVVSHVTSEDLNISNQGKIASSNTSALQLFPNPTSGQLNLRFPEVVEASVQLLIRDTRGQIVQQEWVNEIAQEKMTFSVQSLPAGHYTMEVRKEGKQVKILPFMIAKE